MKLLTFNGGVHPEEKKELSRNSKIRKLSPPEYLYLHLSQHTGAPSKPILEKKDEVKPGQKIAESSGKLSVPLHSPVHGTFMGLEEYPHPTGGFGKAIKIKVNQEEENIFEGEDRDYDSFSKDEIIEIIKESGIVGMGGAAFPTYFKLQPPPGKEIKDLIINGAECEPYLTSDYRVMLEKTEGILKGVEVLKKILEPENIWIAVENNKMDVVERFKEFSSHYPGFRIIALKTKYPQGSEKQLIDAITGREVPEGGLPFDASSYVQNVGTALAIHEALAYGKPLIERVITITGSLRHPSNFMVPIGTPFEYLIENAGGVLGKEAKIINGGPMMGIAQSRKDVPVVKGTTGIVVLDEEEVIERKTGPCIRCAACVDSCPIYLSPTEIYKAVEVEDFERAEELGVLSCIECGTCAFECPAKIPLTQHFKLAKNEIHERRN